MGQVIYLERIRVDVGATAVACSVATAASYLEDEIFSEGRHRSDVPWWIVLPSQEAGQQSREWVADQLASMDYLRQGAANPYLIEVNNNPFDIGLLDIQVFMDVKDQTDVKRLLQTSTQDLLKHNCIHLDSLVRTALHDRMVLFQTLHLVGSDGGLTLHYHNIVLGLRRQDAAVGFLDMVPLLNKLNHKVKLGFVL